MNIHEESFVKNFIVLPKRERYLEFLASEKKRYKTTWYIEQCDDLEENYKNRVSIDKQNPSDIYKILKEKSAPDSCYIISYLDEVDQKEMSLKKAIDEHFFDDGTFISCIPGKLVYYASEEENGCFILEKND
jgi:hypothetical protein